ncbi:MAG TPA: rhodanese-like domain-containing protein [Burkholderiales bacterium]|nr:rhodanese-like domain-containing protein [Burkholderiales bacterium]
MSESVVEFIQQNIWLVIIAVVSGVLFIWPTVAKLFSRAREVGVADAVRLINRMDAVIVDVREPHEFRSGHIPNARNIPMGQLKDRMKELEKFKNRPILLVCQTGQRSGQMCTSLVDEGFTETVGLAGGMGAWQQANMPVEKES